MIITQINGLSFELNDNFTATITNSNNAKGDILIPCSIEHQMNNYTITKIGQYSFKSNTTIKSISFPDNSQIISIDSEAFSLSSLCSISIPSHLRYIGARAFYQCLCLKAISFSEESELQTIGKEAFSYSSLHQISIPKSVTQIEEGAFSECRDLDKIEIPENSELRIIEEKAFAFTSIESLFIPSKLIEIKEDWCIGIKKLNEIKISSTNKNFKIHSNKILLFKSNQNETDFDCLLFSCRNIETTTIPSSIKHICSFAFSNCLKLQNIEIPENSELISIGKESFMNCCIRKIFIPKHVKIIDESAFYGCTQLKSVILQNDSELESINKEAFSFASIPSFSIPIHLKQIGKGAFSRCSSLKKLEIPENSELRIIEEKAFAFTSIESLFIPSKLIEIKEDWCIGIKKLNEIKISSTNKNFKIHSNKILLFKSNQNETDFDCLLFSCRNIENLIIPSSIKQISSFAFSNCKKLNTIKFNEDSELEIIKDAAFSSSSLKFILLPKKLNFLCQRAFSFCTFFKSAEFLSDSLSLESFCFERCSSLIIISFPNAKQVTITKDIFSSLNNDACILLCSNSNIINATTT